MTVGSGGCRLIFPFFFTTSLEAIWYTILSHGRFRVDGNLWRITTSFLAFMFFFVTISISTRLSIFVSARNGFMARIYFIGSCFPRTALQAALQGPDTSCGRVWFFFTFNFAKSELLINLKIQKHEKKLPVKKMDSQNMKRMFIRQNQSPVAFGRKKAVTCQLMDRVWVRPAGWPFN